MPEGDTVWRVAARLHKALAGRPLRRTDFRVPRLATTDLAGRTVSEVVARGKHLLTRVDGGLTLHSHLRMDGSWHLYRPGQARHGGPDWQVRAVLENADWLVVGYRLPVLELVATAEESEIVGHLGPDLLGADWDEAQSLRRLRADPAREIGEALLDQRLLAGIGNLYKCETLFLRGRSPWTRVVDVHDLAEVVRLARRLLTANKAVPEQSTTGDTRRGREHWVYGRADRPCRRCGARIAAAEQGPPGYARLTFWCPRCQPGPARA
jgi:endonuclease-8